MTAMPASFDLPAPRAAPPLADKADSQWRMAEHWPELVLAITDQSIESVNFLMRGLELMVQRGKLSEAEFQVLATPALRLRRCGIQAQQIIRFQSGQVRQSHEKIDLAHVVESVLQERREHLALQGITLRHKFTPTELLIDPTLGYSLAQTMLDWSARLGRHIELRIDSTPQQPPRGRLWMKIHRPEPVASSAVFHDSMQWLLLRQIAATDGGIELQRQLTHEGVELSAYFQRLLEPSAKASAPMQASDGSLSSTG